MPEFRLSPAAERDLDEIWRYTFQRWGKEQANRYTTVIMAVCSDLAISPKDGQDCSSIRQGYRRFRVERHVIYFKQSTYGIAVIRILHERMDAPRHF